MKEKHINWFLVILTMVVMGLLFVSLGRDIREKTCYNETYNLWQSVNEDYPYFMTSQESYDKHNRQACASFYYIACMNGDRVNCAKTQEEKNK